MTTFTKNEFGSEYVYLSRNNKFLATVVKNETSMSETKKSILTIELVSNVSLQAVQFVLRAFIVRVCRRAKMQSGRIIAKLPRKYAKVGPNVQ